MHRVLNEAELLKGVDGLTEVARNWREDRIRQGANPHQFFAARRRRNSSFTPRSSVETE